ncbi:hypothetical protein PENTCL1PPCAC_12960, partial [Pristionchus entomophagus]
TSSIRSSRSGSVRSVAMPSPSTSTIRLRRWPSCFISSISSSRRRTDGCPWPRESPSESWLIWPTSTPAPASSSGYRSRWVILPCLTVPRQT